MFYEKVLLDVDNTEIYMDAYIAAQISPFKRKAILILPGGGYGELCTDREGEAVAQAFMPYGYNAFVMHYSVGRKTKFPAQLIEVSKAIKHIKDNYQKYNIDSDNVFVVGFSAGGHLAGSIGIMWNKKEIYNCIEMPCGYNKPKGVMLIYPVVSSNKEFCQELTFANLLARDEPTQEEKDVCSIEKFVDENSAPAYIMHTSNDDLVNVRNSLALADAYARAGHKFEMHIYPDAPHGVGLANKITSCGHEKLENVSISKWVENAVAWADSL